MKALPERIEQLAAPITRQIWLKRRENDTAVVGGILGIDRRVQIDGGTKGLLALTGLKPGDEIPLWHDEEAAGRLQRPVEAETGLWSAQDVPDFLVQFEFGLPKLIGV